MEKTVNNDISNGNSSLIHQHNDDTENDTVTNKRASAMSAVELKMIPKRTTFHVKKGTSATFQLYHITFTMQSRIGRGVAFDWLGEAQFIYCYIMIENVS